MNGYQVNQKKRDSLSLQRLKWLFIIGCDLAIVVMLIIYGIEFDVF